MKEFNLLIWLTQLGLSVSLPLAGFLMLGLWLHNSIGWGMWTVWTGLVLGIIGAVNGFRDSIRAMEKMTGKNSPGDPPPTAYNSHD